MDRTASLATRQDCLQPCPAIWVTHRLQVHDHNPAAAELMTLQDAPLRLHQGWLRARHADTQAQLLSPVAGVLSGRDEPARGKRAMLALRPERPPWTLSVSRDGHPGLALVLVRDPTRTRVCPSLLQDLFGLTGSEAAVAASLCDGLSPTEMASALQVQTNTVHAHLKKALAKTGTRRQSQLVALLLRSVAACDQLRPSPDHA